MLNVVNALVTNVSAIESYRIATAENRSKELTV
jgi:hypothetical protein